MPRNRQAFRRLRVLILVACFFASVTLSVGIFMSAIREHESVEPRVLKNSSALSRILAEHLGNIFRAIDGRFLAIEKKIKTAQSLERAFEEIEGVIYWFVLDPQGRVQTASDSAIQRQQIPALPPAAQIISEAKKTGFYIGSPETTLGTSARFIPILRPFYGAQGNLEGYLGAGLDDRYFDNFFRDLQAWGPNGIVIVAENGPIILRYPTIPGAIGRDFRGKSPIWDEASAHGTGWYYEDSPVDGIRKMIHYRKVNGAPVIIMINRAKSEIFAPWMIATWVRIGTLLFGIGAVAILGTMLWWQLKRLENDQENLRLYRAYAMKSQRFESIGRFAGGIAHDFNNILTILFGHLDRLGQLLPEKYQANQRQFMDSALLARDLVRRILAFSRPQPAGIRSVSIDEWLEEARPLLQAAVPRSVNLHIRVQPGLYLYGDPDHLTQVVMHLVSNANEALENGEGVLELSIDALKAEARPEIRLRVKDNGVGIEHSRIATVFSPFYTTKESEGAGLGLALTKSLVEAAGGRIQLSSQRGVGTSVEVYWPEARPLLSAVLATPAVDELAPVSTEVLFVDDESAVVELVSDALVGDGISVLAVTDPLAALEAFGHEPKRFGLLVTDINMRQMTGFELADELRRLNPSLRIIFTTAHPEYEIEAEQRSSKDPEHILLLRKPYHLEQLVECIRARVVFKKMDVRDFTSR